jgi:hypothetical protein
MEGGIGVGVVFLGGVLSFSVTAVVNCIALQNMM